MLKLFNVKKNGEALESGAADLGHRHHTSNGLYKEVKLFISRAFSFDINICKDSRAFIEYNLEENIQGQRKFIESVFHKYSDLFSILLINGENYKFRKTGIYPNHVYSKLMEQKLHWHGYIRFKEPMTRNQYENFFNRKIRPNFTVRHQSNPHRALAFKKIKDQSNLEDRMKYQAKQQPCICTPILFNGS